MKIRPVGAELFLADGRTDRQTDRHDEASNRFLQFLRTRLKNVSPFSTTVLNNMAEISHHTLLFGA